MASRRSQLRLLILSFEDEAKVWRRWIRAYHHTTIPHVVLAISVARRKGVAQTAMTEDHNNGKPQHA